MVIIVESGATKTSWRAVSEDGHVRDVLTEGLNPNCLDEEHIGEIVRKALPELNPEGRNISRVFFYGAGMVSPESSAPVRNVLDMWCPFAQIEFHSDMLAAARALFGDGSGVVAIMGTGSNSCLYRNGEIVRNIRPGGYVLGDEGSAVALGKAFLADYIKELVPEDLAEQFHQRFRLDYPQIVRKVYKENAASAFMGSLAPFIMEHIDNQYVSSMLEDCLEAFVRRSLSRYGVESGAEVGADGCKVGIDGARSGIDGVKVGVVGSFGCACEPILRKIGERYGLEFVRFIKSPIDELVQYHSARSDR